jgi:predicted nucleotidyltransferase
MKPSAALERNRSAIRAAVARYRTSNPRVFGSVVRNEDTEQSDLDILVDTLPATTLFDLGGLQADLEDLLGVRVHLVTTNGLAMRFRHRILAEARPV